MNYNEAMQYIKNTSKFGSNYGLERTEKILELLGSPHKKLKCIHIAGTNGKGSTTAMISEILLVSGYKVGMYTSPYLEEFEERIQINNANIPKDELAVYVTKVSEAVEEVIAAGYDHPTEFEIITCTMFLYFYEKNVDYAVVEVGLGGRLDSTNVITPLISVITSISYDHMNILGNSISEIAFEKAGIIKPGVPVILYPQLTESEKVIEKACVERGCRLVKVSGDSTVFAGVSGNKQKIRISTPGDLYEIELSLLGKHQLLNCAAAVTTVEELKALGTQIEKTEVIKALGRVKWPGRLEVMGSSPLVVIDGAHNSDGIAKLSESLDLYFNYKRMILILGILADKQVDEMVAALAPKAYRVIAVTPHSDRAELAEELEKVVQKHGVACEAVEDYEEAFIKALGMCEKEDLLMISGSLYMIGDMRKIIRNAKK